MSISSEELDVLRNKVVFDTTNEKYVLSQDYEKVLHSSEYKVLGFHKNTFYSISDGYVEKNTIDGVAFAQAKLDIDHGSFHEQSDVFYLYKDKNLYCVNTNLEVLWHKECADTIQSVKTDYSGYAYVLYRNITSYEKIKKDGTSIMTVATSYDPSKKCTAYSQFLTSNCSMLYILLTIYDEIHSHLVSYLDIYDTYSGTRIERINKDNTYTNTYYSPDFDYKNLKISDDSMYYMTYSKVIKCTIHGLNKIGDNWKINKVNTELSLLEYDDSDCSENIYYCGSKDNGYYFGKMSSNGIGLWEVLYENSSDSKESYADFKLCIYNKLLYTTSKNNIASSSHYVLSLNNGGIVLESRNGVLIKVSEVGYDDIYTSENYYKAYMITDKLKDDVETIENLPLGYQYGIFRTSDSRLILIRRQKTEFDYDDYDYKKLRYCETTDGATETVILTDNDLQILTKQGSIIETKEPYNYDTINMILTSLYGEDYLQTLSEKDLEVLRTKYVNTGYLLADKFKFIDYLVTKKNRDIIITKKKGFAIVRKKSQIYKYVFKRLNEIDVIVEYFMQNKVEKTKLPEYIDRLRHHTTSMIDSIQVAKIPCLYNIDSTMKFEYFYDGLKYKVRDSGTQVWRCNNIPFYPSHKYKIYIDSMSNLVSKREVKPFVVFINGKAIKWSNIAIVKDWKDSYLIIRGVDNQDTSYKMDCILFPCTIRYGEDNDILPLSNKSKLLAFDEDGLFTSDTDRIAIRIEITDSKIACTEKVYVANGVMQVAADYGKISTENNLIIFNGLKLNSKMNNGMVCYGNNIFKYNYPEDITNDNIIVKGYYFIDANISENMIYNFPNENTVEKDIMSNATNPTSDTDYINKYISKTGEFDFKLYRNKTWSRNISEALKYIMGYDMALLIDFYKDQSNIKPFTYTGRKIVDLMDAKSPEYGANLVMPRLINNGLDDFIVVFYNNALYELYKQLEYRTREFYLPIFDRISIYDQIEIAHFRNVDNTQYTITVTEDEMDYVSENLRHHNFLLFANSPTGSTTYSSYHNDYSIQYDVEYEYENKYDDKGKYLGTKIKLTDPYFYGKELNIISKRQFRYMHYDINASNMQPADGHYHLSPDFKFCHTKNQYMIFVNRRKLLLSDWDAIIYDGPTDERYIGIRLNQELSIGDELEVFYIPDAYEEIPVDISVDGVKQKGDIIVNTDDLGYPFDKELAFIFADGMKINPDNITNVSITRVLISKLTEITQNDNPSVHICKFMDADETLQKVFSYSDMWSDDVKYLTSSKYKELFNK